jgi:hypothetical protein
MLAWVDIEALVRSEGHQCKAGVPSCSKLPRLITCPHSRRYADGTSNASDAAFRGSCLHKCMELGIVPEDIDDEGRWLLERAGNMEHGFGRAIAREYYIEHPELTGTIDVVLKNATCTLVLADYKFGRNRVGPESLQLGGYAALWMNQNEEFSEVETAVIQPYAPTVLTSLWTRERVEAEIWQPLRQLDDTCKTGAHCRYCRGFLNCPKTQGATYEFGQE